MKREYEVIYRTPLRATREDRAEWLELRRNGVGASDGFNESTMKVKIGYKSSFVGNDATALGHLLEDDIISFANNQKGFCARSSQSVLRSIEHPDMMCTLDGVCRMPESDYRLNKLCNFLLGELRWSKMEVLHAVNDKRIAVFEIKAPAIKQLPKWESKTPPLQYWRQVQHQMAVTGFQVGWLVGLLDKQLKVFRIERDNKFIAKRRKQAFDFMRTVEARRKQGY